MKSKLTKSEQEELNMIGEYQPVFAGDVISKDSIASLLSKGLVMHYNDVNGGYCLTEKGKQYFELPINKLGNKKDKNRGIFKC